MKPIFKSLATLLLILAIGIGPCMADKVKTTRSNLHPVEVKAKKRNSTGCIHGNPDVIRLCGYEKTLSSNRETIFIQNLSDSTINAIFIDITYLDTSRREINRRKVTLDVEIPPRSTRRYDIPSWDRQKSYYYIKGIRPRREATPYDVSIATDSIHTISSLTPCTP